MALSESVNSSGGFLVRPQYMQVNTRTGALRASPAIPFGNVDGSMAKYMKNKSGWTHRGPTGKKRKKR